jgi:diguanylate cyclase (GGDEF)-like protein
MELTQDVLLPVLILTIVANAAIIVILLASGRLGRRKSVTAAVDQGPAFDQGIMTTSYNDRTASASWPTASSSIRDDHARATDLDAGYAVEDDVIDPSAVDDPAAAAATPSDAADPAPAGDADAEDGLDALTGLPDMSVFSRLVSDEDARIARYHRAATIVVFELDGLDRLSERLGQDAGDRIVAALADTIRRLARSADHVARVADGRFAVLLPETDEVAAINYVERVRRACELWLDTGAIALRLAIGWAGTTGETSMTDVQRIATDRMYTELRRGGRRGDGAETPAP